MNKKIIAFMTAAAAMLTVLMMVMMCMLLFDLREQLLHHGIRLLDEL